MTVRTTVTEVTILGSKLETRQVFFVYRCDWRSCKSTDGGWILVRIEVCLMNILDVAFLIQNVRIDDRTVIVVEVIHNSVIIKVTTIYILTMTHNDPLCVTYDNSSVVLSYMSAVLSYHCSYRCVFVNGVD